MLSNNFNFFESGFNHILVKYKKLAFTEEASVFSQDPLLLSYSYLGKRAAVISHVL